MKKTQARVLYTPPSEPLRNLPECPRMLQNNGGAPTLAWINIQRSSDSKAGDMNLLNLTTLSNRTIPLPGRPGFFAETSTPGTLVVGMDRRLVLLNLESGEVTETGIEVTSDPRVLMSDGVAIEGGLLFGTKHLEFSQPLASLYHYDCATRTLREVLKEQTCSNGKHFFVNEAGHVLIDIDSVPRALTRYQFDAQFDRLLGSAHVTPPEALPSVPDGLRPTPDGAAVVVAFFNPEAVTDGMAQQIRLSDGAVEAEWIFPGSPRVTCPEVARIDGAVKLIFTTAVDGMPDQVRASAPNAGCLFIADTAFTGAPITPPLVDAASFR